MGSGIIGRHLQASKDARDTVFRRRMEIRLYVGVCTGSYGAVNAGDTVFRRRYENQFVGMRSSYIVDSTGSFNGLGRLETKVLMFSANNKKSNILTI